MAEEAGSPAEGSPAGGEPAAGSSEGSAQTFDFGAFKDGLGEMGQDKSLEPIKDLHGLTKSYIESQKMIGNSIRLPGKDLEPEARTKAVSDITARLSKEGILEGAPETSDGYELPIPTIEGFNANEPMIASFKEMAHKIGLSSSKANDLFSWYLNHQEETNANSQVEFENMKASMKQEFGGLYPRKMEAARRAVAKYMGVDGDDIISGLPPDVGRKLVMAFAEIGDPMLEDSLILGETVQGVESKDEVRGKMEAMMLDKNHPLMDLTHPGHNKALEEYTKLNKMLSMMG
jgi:hypothetical protein